MTRQRALWAYMADVAGRYYGRPATDAEITAATSEDPSDDLQPPQGLFIAAWQHNNLVGCGGLRWLEGCAAEVKRVYVAASARGRGLGTRLVGELERLAREQHRTTLRLDTRSDLIEARRLYVRLGYRQVTAYNAGPYAEHWFEKALT